MKKKKNHIQALSIFLEAPARGVFSDKQDYSLKTSDLGSWGFFHSF